MRLVERLEPAHVAALLLCLVALLTLPPKVPAFLTRLDLLLYDLLLPVQAPIMSPDITVVAIDERSVENLGRWPWDRRIHARLIERLSALGARSIALDILFTESDREDPDSDRQLAAAIEAAKVVLPVAPRQPQDGGPIGELLPIPRLAASASALGHVDTELDVDGLCRSVFLRAGLGEARWPTLGLAMLQAEGETPDGLVAGEQATPLSAGWVRSGYRLIPFAGPDDAAREVSYSDVLEGRVAADSIAGKWVLVGVTATGLGDALSTPGAAAHGRMPGVSLNAQILNGLLQGALISPLESTRARLLSFVFAATVAMLLVYAPMRLGAVIALVGVAVALATAALLLALQRSWFAPATSLLSIIVAFALSAAWRHRREQRLQDTLRAQLSHLAHHHAATGLPNHTMLEHRLERLAENSHGQTVCALLVMHLTWPGSATIVLARPMRDAVLQAIRDRLRAISESGYFVAHMAGDDFAVLMPDFTDREAARQAAAGFLEQLQQPMEFDGNTLLLAPRIGVSVWPDDTEEPTQLLRNAYTAMFTSRIDDSDHLCMYSASVSSDLNRRSQLEQAIAYALERHEFQLHYQPQVGSGGGGIIGVEALLRWNSRELGWVSPASFIPVAEHVGLIGSLGAWVIEESCRQLKLWNLAGRLGLRMAINISPLQFLAPGLPQLLMDAISRAGVGVDFVELEITESSLMRDVNRAVTIMHELRELGFGLAIDDFGTGHSSLSSLRHFPLDRLKIDRAFIAEIESSRDAREITLTIISMARQLGLSVIAEGVETQQQASFLRDNGCDELQGFLFARPMPPDDLTDMLFATSLRGFAQGL